MTVKMGSGSEPAVRLGRCSGGNGDSDRESIAGFSVPELVKFLKTRFRPRDFTKVEQVLLSREEKLKAETELLRSENELLRSENEKLQEERELDRLEKIAIETKLKESERERKNLEAQVDKHERELTERVAALERGLKKRSEEGICLEKPSGSGIEEKVPGKVFGENENDKKKVFDNVKAEVIDCEEISHLGAKGGRRTLQGSMRPLSKDIVEIFDSDDENAPRDKVLKRKQASCASVEGNDKGDRSGNGVNPEASCFGDKHKISRVLDGSSPSSAITKSCTNTSGKIIARTNLNPMVSGQSKEKQRGVFDNKSDTDDSDSVGSYSSSDLENDLLSDGLFCSIFQRKPKWATEADMVAAFEKDQELCLKAVCSLYRQQIHFGKTVYGSSTSHNGGVNKFSTVRGMVLAKFLIDGDPEGKLKRTVADLVAYDSKGLDECKRLAIEHSKQLFQIYEEKEDPLFLD